MTNGLIFSTGDVGEPLGWASCIYRSCSAIPPEPFLAASSGARLKGGVGCFSLMAWGPFSGNLLSCQLTVELVVWNQLPFVGFVCMFGTARNAMAGRGLGSISRDLLHGA